MSRVRAALDEAKYYILYAIKSGGRPDPVASFRKSLVMIQDGVNCFQEGLNLLCSSKDKPTDMLLGSLHEILFNLNEIFASLFAPEDLYKMQQTINYFINNPSVGAEETQKLPPTLEKLMILDVL